MSVAENILAVKEKISAAAYRAGRNPREIKLIAVTKTVEPETMEEALKAGINSFGENRVQELVRKAPFFPETLEWHLIGHLQTNKVKQVAGRVDLIHSLDRVSLAKELSLQTQARGIKVPALVQVNISGEATKYGLAQGEVMDFLSEISGYQGLEIKGLMTMAPLVAVQEEARPVFRGLAELSRRISDKIPGVKMQWLSMGMSNDYEVAVEEGANIVRVGSAIFGSRY